MTHSRVKRYPSKPDYWLLAATIALLAIGLVSVYSAAMALDPENPASYLLRQGVWAGIGLAGLFVMARFDYKRWKLYAVPFLALALIALVVVLLLGAEVFGSRRWFLRGSIQPSEMMKIALVVYVAYWLSSKGPEIRQATYGLIPFSMIVGSVMALILFQPDFSTAMLIAAIAMVMFFIAGADIWQMALTCMLGLVPVAALILGSGYRAERLLVFQESLKDPLSAGYHVRQVVIALGSGGLAGRGLGGGVLKFNWLPAVHTDSIYAVIGEETGFIGCVLILALFAFFGWRGLRAATQAESPFGTFLAGGLTIMIVTQAAINIAVATATVPFTGIPLPFISFGGSSLVVCLTAVGIIFNVSGHRVEEE